jgi:hypothetical protein
MPDETLGDTTVGIDRCSDLFHAHISPRERNKVLWLLSGRKMMKGPRPPLELKLDICTVQRWELLSRAVQEFPAILDYFDPIPELQTNTGPLKIWKKSKYLRYKAKNQPELDDEPSSLVLLAFSTAIALYGGLHAGAW